MTDALDPHRAPLNGQQLTLQPLLERVDHSELRESQFEVARPAGMPPAGDSTGGGIAAVIIVVVLFGIATAVAWMLYAVVGALVAAIVSNYGGEPSLAGLMN